MRKMIFVCLALLSLLASCQTSFPINSAAENEITAPIPSELANPDDIHSEICQTTEPFIASKPPQRERVLNNGDIKNIYYGSPGTLLLRTSNAIYWYDVGSEKILAQRPMDNWLSVTFYPIDDGFCAIGSLPKSLSADENTGSFISSSSDTLCIFYDKAFHEMERITLNNLENGADYISCTALSTSGNMIAYCTIDKLYCYDRTSSTSKLILNLGYDYIESNSGLSSISAMVFSKEEDSILFCGNTFSLPIMTGQHSFITYGYVALNGSKLENKKFQNFEAGAMVYATSEYLFFEESLNAASGKLSIIDNDNLCQRTYSLNSVREGEAGLFCSQNGGYYATVEMANSQWIVHIYESKDGQLICTQLVDVTEDKFSYRTPAIYILDDLKICIVKLGGFNDIPSEIISFSL